MDQTHIDAAYGLLLIISGFFTVLFGAIALSALNSESVEERKIKLKKGSKVYDGISG